MREHWNIARSAARFFGLQGAPDLLRAAGRRAMRDTGRLQRLRPAGLPHPVHVRPGGTDLRVLGQIFIRGDYRFPSAQHEGKLRRHYDTLLAAGRVPVIVDCGANIGFAAIWYARLFPEARILAVEPESANHEVLCLNVAAYPNITPVHAAISDRKTHVDMHNASEGASWAWETRESEAGEVETCTVPELLDRVPSGAPFIVKVDIEGGEVELFRSNTGWVEATPLIVFETHDWMFQWRGTAHAIYKALTVSPRDYLQSGENTFAFCHRLRRGSRSAAPAGRARLILVEAAP